MTVYKLVKNFPPRVAAAEASLSCSQYPATGHCYERYDILSLEDQLKYYFLLLRYGGRDSSVGIATRYGLDGPGIESR